MELKSQIRLSEPSPVAFDRHSRLAADGYTRDRIEYEGLEGDLIPAFLFTPQDREPTGGVVVYHQHNGEFHLGKSEVAGEQGDALQAFGPILARMGVAVLAPDSITFEDRRAGVRGVQPDNGDWLQHYNALAYRLLDGDSLMRKCLDDAQRGLSVLMHAESLGGRRVGVIGHSFGGLTALYHAAVDLRCEFACVSGAVCSFERRRREGTGINMFEVVPGLCTRLETRDLLMCIRPRPMLIVSGTDDPYSRDADEVVGSAGGPFLTEVRAEGGHSLDRGRFEAIVKWTSMQAAIRE